MGTLRKFRRSIEKSILRFDPTMYNNVLGSLVITHYILRTLDGEDVDISKIKSTWRKLSKKKSLDFWLDDKDFIVKALALFDMQPLYGRFAMCQSAFNVLFLPYIDGTVLPIREDGIYPMSAKSGKIYPVLETNKETEEEKENAGE
jgi:hypothetical protein